MADTHPGTRLREKPEDFLRRLRELDRFFQGKDAVHQTMRRLARRLERKNIPYAVVGGMAVFAHRHHRATDDVDVLLSAEGFQGFRDLFVPKNYEAVPQRRRRFRDRSSDITIDVLVTGMFPGSGKPGSIVYPNPAVVSEVIRNVRFVNLETLIPLELATRRYQGFADVVSLIRAHDLDEAFADRLHPSIRRDYVECLEEKRREDEYEARNG